MIPPVILSLVACIVLCPLCLALLHFVQIGIFVSAFSGNPRSIFAEKYKNKHIEEVLRLMKEEGLNRGLTVLRSPKATMGSLQKLDIKSAIKCEGSKCWESMKYFMVDDADIVVAEVGVSFPRDTYSVSAWHRGIVRQYSNVAQDYSP